MVILCEKVWKVFMEYIHLSFLNKLLNLKKIGETA